MVLNNLCLHDHCSVPTYPRKRTKGCRRNTEESLSSTSPTPLGGADGPGSCRGADAVDSPSRVFAISSKFDIKRIRLCRDSSNEVSTQRRPGSRPTIARTGTSEPGRPTRLLVSVWKIIYSVWELIVGSYPASWARRARGRLGLWKTKGLATYSRGSGNTAHSAGENYLITNTTI